MKTSALHASPRESAYLHAGLAVVRSNKEGVSFESTRFALDASVVELPVAKFRQATGFLISSRFCRFVSVPWSDFLLDSEVSCYHNAFAEAYGEVAPGTRFAAADEAYGQARVVCALDGALLADLEGWAARHERRTAYVRPAVQVAFEFFRRQMSGTAGVFALREASVLSLVYWESGRVTEVDTFALAGGDWKSRLVHEVRRARLHSGNSGRLYVADAWKDAARARIKDAVVLRWTSACAKAAPDPVFRLASCGL